MTAADTRLAALLRCVVREELERAESRRRGERPAGQRRIRSPELAAKLAREQSGPVDDLTAARVDRVIAQARRRRSALVARPVERGTGWGTSSKPPRRFELRTYGLRTRGPGPVAHEGSASIGLDVPHLVPRLADARDRLLAALEASDPWRDRRALDLVEAVTALLDAIERPARGEGVG